MVKNFLGTVPVHADGSAYFEAPPGRALYFEALDAEGREVQRMRTFVHAVPGVTRSCVGCHESEHATPASVGQPLALQHEPAKLEPESWGSGFVDYAAMVQPILDRHCVRGRVALGLGARRHLARLRLPNGLDYEDLQKARGGARTRPGEPYQVLGRMAGLKAYRRAVRPAEALASFRNGKP